MGNTQEHSSTDSSLAHTRRHEGSLSWKSFCVSVPLLVVIVASSSFNGYKNAIETLKHANEGCLHVVKNETNQPTISNALFGNEQLLQSEEHLVQYGDIIYIREDWDGAPIILEEYKFVFFSTAKVACTVWKQLFRRLMGYDDWAIEEYQKMLPWNPATNGLKYLYDYDRETASHMMTSPEWTRAIFVRDPKERLISAYLDKGKGNPNYMRQKCCSYKGDCVTNASSSLAGFLNVAYFCDNAHWRPQAKRMEDKYWSFINFVGRMESLAEDAEQLLRQIGAWQPFGSSGWGPNGTLPIFQTKAGGAGRHHATNARKKLENLISSAELEDDIENFYKYDYINPVLRFEKRRIHSHSDGE